MARRRMFSLDVVDTDKFACLSKDARYLYYELGVRADDDGFIGAPMRIVKMSDCNEADLKELIENEYVINFKSGVIAVKDWKINNQIRKDRYKPTIYKQERELLNDGEDGYTLSTNGKPSDIPEDKPNDIPQNTDTVPKPHKTDVSGDGNQGYDFGVPQVRLGKVRLGKDRLEEYSLISDPQQVVDLFNQICKSFEPVTNILDYSQELSLSLLNGFTKHDYMIAFDKTENSDYLKGLTPKIKQPSSFSWILEHLEEIKQGKYDDFKKGEQNNETMVNI